MHTLRELLTQLNSAADATVAALHTAAIARVEAEAACISTLTRDGALPALLACLQHKSALVVGAGLSVLLKCAQQLPGDAVHLAEDPHCATLLASLLSKHAQELVKPGPDGRSSSQAQPHVTSQASVYDWQTAAGRLQTVAQLLWVCTATQHAAQQFLQLAPGIVPSLLGLISQPHASLLAPTLGCLLNLSSAVPSLATQLARNGDLVHLLVSITARAEHVTTATSGISLTADIEQEAVAAGNALGLLGCLVVAPQQAQQVLAAEQTLLRVMGVLLSSPPHGCAKETHLHLRDCAALVLLRLMEHADTPATLYSHIHTLMSHVAQATDDQAQALLATPHLRKCLIVPPTRVSEVILNQPTYEHESVHSSGGRQTTGVRWATDISESQTGSVQTMSGVPVGGSPASRGATPVQGGKGVVNMSRDAMGALVRVPLGACAAGWESDAGTLLQACSNAIEVLHSLVSTDACAEEVSRDHSGVVQLLGTLLQDGAVRLTQPGWTRVTLTCAATLAGLAQYPCIRRLPAMQSALRPSSTTLTHLVSLLTTPPASTTTEEQPGASLAEDTYAHHCVTCYLAAVCTHGAADQGEVVQRQRAACHCAERPVVAAPPRRRVGRRQASSIACSASHSNPTVFSATLLERQAQTPATSGHRHLTQPSLPVPVEPVMPRVYEYLGLAQAIVDFTAPLPSDQCLARPPFTVAKGQRRVISLEERHAVLEELEDLGCESQALTQARGALGAVLALAPDDRVSDTTQRQGTSQLQTPIGGTSFSGTAGVVGPVGGLQVSVPDNWIAEYHHAVLQIAAPRLDLEDIQSHVVPEGLLAALTLLRCVSSRRALAKLLATKTSLPVTCVNLMSGTSREARWRSIMTQQGVLTLHALIQSLDPSVVAAEVLTDPDLLPGLMLALQASSPSCRAAAFDLAASLVLHTDFVLALASKSHTADIAHLAMTELGLLTQAQLPNASPGKKLQSPLQPAMPAYSPLSPAPDHLTHPHAHTSSFSTPGRTAAATLLLRLLHPPSPSPITHLLLVPGVLDKLIHNIATLIDEARRLGPSVFSFSGGLIATLLSVLTLCFECGVRACVLPTDVRQGAGAVHGEVVGVGQGGVVCQGVWGDVVMTLRETPEVLAVVVDASDWASGLLTSGPKDKSLYSAPSGPASDQGAAPRYARMPSSRLAVAHMASHDPSDVSMQGSPDPSAHSAAGRVMGGPGVLVEPLSDELRARVEDIQILSLRCARNLLLALFAASPAPDLSDIERPPSTYDEGHDGQHDMSKLRNPAGVTSKRGLAMEAPGVMAIDSPPLPAVLKPGSPARPAFTRAHRRTATVGDMPLHSPQLSPLGAGPRAASTSPVPGYHGCPPRRVSSLVRSLAMACCTLLAGKPSPGLMQAAVACLGTSMACSDALVAFLCSVAPQCLDCLLGIAGLQIMDTVVSYSGAQHEEVALAIAAAPAAAAALLDSKSAPSAMGTDPNTWQHGQTTANRGTMTSAKSAEAGLNSIVLPSMLDPYASVAGRSMATGLTSTSTGSATLQQLCALAHAILAALDALRYVSANAQVLPRLVGRPQLGEVFDALLATDNVQQVHAVLELVHAQCDAQGRMQGAAGDKFRTAPAPGQDKGPGSTTVLPTPAPAEDTAAPLPCVRELSAAIVAACGPCAAMQGVEMVGPAGNLLTCLAALLSDTDQGPSNGHAVALQALMGLIATEGAPRALIRQAARDTGSVVAGLIAVFKTDKADLRMHAAGVLASLVQRVSGAQLTELGAVDGLLPTLVDVASSCADAHARLQESTKPSDLNTSQRLSQASQHRLSRLGPTDTSMDISDTEHPTSALTGNTDPIVATWLCAIAALAGLSASGPVAAKIASLRGVPGVILQALRAQPQSGLPLYAAGLVGNLAKHTASQSLLAMTQGLAKEVARALRQHEDQSDSWDSVELLLGAVRNLAATDKGRQELASDHELVPYLQHLLDTKNETQESSQHLHLQALCMSILANLSADKAGLEAFVSSGAAAELLATALHILQHETPTVPVQQAPCGEPTRAVTPMGDVPHASNDVAGTGQTGAQDVARPFLARLQCHSAVLLANALSHSDLAATFLGLSDAHLLRDAVLLLPSPSLAALSSDPLACLGCTASRARAVACLGAMRNLLVYGGASTLTWLAAQEPLPLPALHQASDRALLRSRSKGDTFRGTSERASTQSGAQRSPGHSVSVTQLVAKVLDLLAWVDFYTPADTVFGQGAAHGSDAGVDVAGAAAGLLGALAAQGCATKFGAAERQAVQHLLRCMALSAADSTAAASNTGAHSSSAVEEAASLAAMTVYVLTSGTDHEQWAACIADDPYIIYALLLLSKRGMKASTRARFATTRLLSAAALGQLLHLGLVSEAMTGQIVSGVLGVPAALMDLVTLATHGAMAGGAKPTHSALDNVRQPRRKGQAPSAAEIQDTARSDALRSVGLLEDMQTTLGRQAARALAHVASHPTGAAAIVSSPATRTALPTLLDSPADPTALTGVMIISGLSSHRDPALLDSLATNMQLMASLQACLSRPHAHIACYAAVCMANFARHPVAQPTVLAPEVLARLAELLTAPLGNETPLLTLPHGETSAGAQHAVHGGDFLDGAAERPAAVRVNSKRVKTDGAPLPPLPPLPPSQPPHKETAGDTDRASGGARIAAWKPPVRTTGAPPGLATLDIPQDSSGPLPEPTPGSGGSGGGVKAELLASCLTAALAAGTALENLSYDGRTCGALLQADCGVLDSMCTLMQRAGEVHQSILETGGKVEYLHSLESLLLLIMGTLANLAAVPQGQAQLLANPVLLAALLAALAAHSPAASYLLTTPTPSMHTELQTPLPSAVLPHLPSPQSQRPTPLHHLATPSTAHSTPSAVHPAELRAVLPSPAALAESLHEAAGGGLTRKLTFAQRSAASPVQVAALGALVNLLVDRAQPRAATPTPDDHDMAQGSQGDHTGGPEVGEGMGEGEGGVKASDMLSLADVMGAVQSGDIDSMQGSLPGPMASVSVKDVRDGIGCKNDQSAQEEDILRGQKALVTMLQSLSAARPVLLALTTSTALSAKPTEEARAVRHMAGWLLHKLGPVRA